MKKLLLIILGIIVFALVAFGGIIGAFYDTEVKPAAVVAHAEELEEIDPCTEGHLIGIYEEEEFRVEAVDFMNPTDAYEFNDAFKYFLEEGDLHWNGGRVPNCQDDEYVIFNCKDCGKLIVIDLKGDHTPGEEVIESEEGNYKVCTVCGEHIEVLDAEEPIETPAEEVIEEPVEEPVEEPTEEPIEEPIEEPSEEIIEEPTEEEPVVDEPEEVVDPEVEEPTEPEATEPTETDTEEITEEIPDEIPDEEEPTETEEPTEGEDTEAEVTEGEVKILGDELLAFVGLKDAAHELGLDTVKKIAVGAVAVFSFLEAFIVMKLFKKSVKVPKGPRGPRPHRRHRRRGPEVPMEGYREQPRKNGLKF